jgi:hypothetical protein
VSRSGGISPPESRSVVIAKKLGIPARPRAAVHPHPEQAGYRPGAHRRNLAWCYWRVRHPSGGTSGPARLRPDRRGGTAPPRGVAGCYPAQARDDCCPACADPALGPGSDSGRGGLCRRYLRHRRRVDPRAHPDRDRAACVRGGARRARAAPTAASAACSPTWPPSPATRSASPAPRHRAHAHRTNQRTARSLPAHRRTHPAHLDVARTPTRPHRQNRRPGPETPTPVSRNFG